MELHSKHIKWCWDNHVFIYPKPLNSLGTIIKIAISKKGKEKTGELKFSQESKKDKIKIYEKINEMYLEIFNKNHKNIL